VGIISYYDPWDEDLIRWDGDLLGLSRKHIGGDPLRLSRKHINMQKKKRNSNDDL
jgi:hypothetical protein